VSPCLPAWPLALAVSAIVARPPVARSPGLGD
jgi:hypothetical protein